MTAWMLSQAALSQVLDRLADGYSVRDAAHTVGITEPGFWNWKKKSREAERECDFTLFYLTWRGRLAFFHDLVGEARKQHAKPPPLPPYARGVNAPAPTAAEVPTYKIGETLSPFPPLATEASPRTIKRPDSPLVRDLLARAAVKPSNPHPLDANGRRTMISTGGMRADDPPENVSTGR